MTNYDKIKNYYKNFDEWKRLDDPEGRLEFILVLDILQNYLEPNSTIFDLGGGPGRYTMELSKSGHKMYMGDLSPDLIKIAREKVESVGNLENIINIDVVNAIDLSNYKNEMFDAVLLFGPLYHLTTKIEIEKCIKEVYRVLKTSGKLFASYIPWITGLSGVMERAFFAPDHVNVKALYDTFKKGIFINQSESGFQEGNYFKTENLTEYLNKNGFKKILLRSIRSIGYKQEKNILNLEKKNRLFFKTIIDIINETSSEPAVVETCGHVIYIGEKC